MYVADEPGFDPGCAAVPADAAGDDLRQSAECRTEGGGRLINFLIVLYQNITFSTEIAKVHR